MPVYSAICQQRTYVRQPAKPVDLYWFLHFEPAPSPHVVVPHRNVVEPAKSRLRATLANARDLLAVRECDLDDLAEAVAEREFLTAEEATLLVAQVHCPDARVRRRMHADHNGSTIEGHRP